jgi:hypothetical protein
MPATTACAKLPYPVDADPIDVTGDLRRLAQAVDTAICTANLVGLAVISAWWDNGGSPPSGCLRCDGSPFDPAVYPELAAHLGASVTPDLRGRFLRGTDAPGGPFPANAQRGGYADAQNAIHSHDLNDHKHAVDHDHPNIVIGGGDHLHNMNHGHDQTLSSVQGQHGHGIGPNAGIALRGFTGLGFPVTGNPGNVFWWEYQDANFQHDGNHQHVTYTPIFYGNTSTVGHSHNVDIPNYTGLSGPSSGSTKDSGADPANRNLPPFQNVTYIIQATPPLR